MESSYELSSILDYLEIFCYISFKEDSNHIAKVLVTEKGISVMNNGKGLSITFEMSSLIEVVTAIVRLAIVLDAK